MTDPEARLSFEPPPEKQTKPGTFSSKPGFLLPAVQALAIQFTSLIILYALLQAAWSLFGLQLTIAIAVLMQGVIAAALSYWRRLPPWWLLIQFREPLHKSS